MSELGRLPDGTAPSAKTPDGVTAPVPDAVPCWMAGRGCDKSAIYRFHHSFLGIGSTCEDHIRPLEIGSCDLIPIVGAS